MIVIDDSPKYQKLFVLKFQSQIVRHFDVIQRAKWAKMLCIWVLNSSNIHSVHFYVEKLCSQFFWSKTNEETFIWRHYSSAVVRWDHELVSFTICTLYCKLLLLLILSKMFFVCQVECNQSIMLVIFLHSKLKQTKKRLNWRYKNAKQTNAVWIASKDTENWWLGSQLKLKTEYQT